MIALWHLDRLIGRLACLVERHNWQTCEATWGTIRRCTRCGAVR